MKIRFVFLLLLLFVAFSSAAEKSFLFLSIIPEKTKDIPGNVAMEMVFIPRIFSNISKRMQQKKIQLSWPSVSFFGNRIFDDAQTDGPVLFVEGMTEPQLRYMLKYRILAENWTFREEAENGQNVFYIHAGSDNQEIPPEFRAFSLKNGMAFVAGNQENIMRNLGELLERKKSVRPDIPVYGTIQLGNFIAHPAMRNVKTLDFQISAEKNGIGELCMKALLYAKGDAPEDTDQIFKNVSAFFTEVYTNAAKAGQLTESHRQAFTVYQEKDCTVIRILLPESFSNDFFTLLNKSIVKELH